MKKNSFKTPHEFHTKLGLLFNGSMAIPLLPFVYLFLEINNRGYEGIYASHGWVHIFGYLFSVIAGIIVVYGLRKCQKLRYIAKSKDTLAEKLRVFFRAKKYLYIAVGIACAILAFGLYLTSAGVIIITYVMLLFYMSFHFPMPRRYVRELHLLDKEKDIMLKQKDYILS